METAFGPGGKRQPPVHRQRVSGGAPVYRWTCDRPRRDGTRAIHHTGEDRRNGRKRFQDGRTSAVDIHVRNIQSTSRAELQGEYKVIHMTRPRALRCQTVDWVCLNNAGMHDLGIPASRLEAIASRFPTRVFIPVGGYLRWSCNDGLQPNSKRNLLAMASNLMST